MEVTDQQVEALRALLLGRIERYKELLQELSEEEVKEGFQLLVSVAFFRAARQRFRGRTRKDIIEWIAHIRSTRDTSDQIDPDVAETMLLWAFDKASVEEVDYRTSADHQVLLLVILLEELYDAPGFEQFLIEVRQRAEQVTS